MIDDLLTARERDVIRLICKGYDDKQINNDLCITQGTLNTHKQNLFSKSLIYDGTRNAHNTKRLRLALWYLQEHKELLDEIEL